VNLSLYNDEPPCVRLAAKFREESVLARVKSLDSRARRHGVASFAGDKSRLVHIGMEVDGSGAVTKNSYGVLSLAWMSEHHPEWPEQVASEVGELRKGIREAHGERLQFLIWAGMGGSAEDKSMYNAVGLLKSGPRCYVLDSTDPAKLKAILEDMTRRSRLPLAQALKRTLVVGMAMGMTSYEPVVNLQKLAALYDKYRIDSRANFIYMTLPGSLLDEFASSRGYRKVELQLDGQNSTAGRHSGPLTRGSLYPLALAKVDLAEWFAGAQLSEDDIHTAWQLSAFLHQQGLAGRDKVTLLLPREWAGAALWTKQNFEESLGKSEDIGIKILIGERIRMANYRSPRDPQQDRAFLVVQRKGSPAVEAKKIALLRRTGYPTAVLTLPSRSPLSTYMQTMHYVVFGIAYLRDMNFVTQPGVELYKSITNRLHAAAQRGGGIAQAKEWRAFLETPRQARWRGAVTLRFDGHTLDRQVATAPEIYAQILRRHFDSRAAEYAELTFFGDTRYSQRGRAIRKVLDRAAETLFRSRLHAPADVYEGPAMNHSYHEMIIGHGKCFSTVLLSEKPEKLPAAEYDPDYHWSQFLATQMALAERQRPVVAITVKDLEERSVAALDEFFRQAARHLED
jgi:glucose-6-phosphate isomerase